MGKQTGRKAGSCGRSEGWKWGCDETGVINQGRSQEGLRARPGRFAFIPKAKGVSFQDLE